MSKIVFIADIHLGYKDRTDDIIEALTAVRDYMAEHNIVYCFILGDLFNDRNSTATDVMDKAYDFFTTIREFGQEWIVYPGNHDIFMKYSWQVNSLKPLNSILTVYDRECLIKVEDQRFWILPYIHDEEVFMRAVDKIAEKAEKDDILLTHIGVNGATLNECFLHKNWSFVNFEGFPLRVYSGHFHCYQQVGDNVWYPGSLIPFRFDEGLVDHGFLVYDIEEREHEFVKIFDQVKLQDFCTILDTSLDTLTEEEVSGNNYKIELARDYTNDEQIQMRERLMKLGAKSVSWRKIVESDVPLSGDVGGDFELSLENHKHLLQTWLDVDKPEHIDHDFLHRLNEDIIDA